MSATRTSLAIALLACMSLAGCKPASDASAPADTASATVAAPAAETPQAADTAAATPTYGVGNFAGVFTGTLPCADCPGIDTTLTLKPDGSYASHAVYRERTSSFDDSGVWSVEDAGKQIRLANQGPDPRVQLYAIASRDELRMLDADGKPIDSGLDYSLKRTPQSP
ncbi:MAG: copper resistance protein NlpE [Thermomonas sp.]